MENDQEAKKKYHREYMREYRKNNIEKFKKYEREKARARRASGWKDDPVKVKIRNQKRDPAKLNEQSKQRRRTIMLEMIDAYGGKCGCCGESTPIFMTIDHVNNDGAKERKTFGGRSGIILYRDLKKRGYPQDGYVLSCFNCNLGRARNGGTCPHKEIK